MLKKLWIPLVIALAVAVSGGAIHHLRGVFGSDDATRSRPVESIVPINPKTVVYEVIGPKWATGSLSYVDEEARPQRVRFAALPWSHAVTTTAPVVFANIVAQSDSSDIACRIMVNDEVKDEQSAQGTHAQTSCLVKAG